MCQRAAGKFSKTCWGLLALLAIDLNACLFGVV
jgi:hypothetical protein